MAAPTTTALTTPTLGFTTLDQELTIDELELNGSLPDWLGGSLLRTGPAKFETGESTDGSIQDMRHWFDGHAMLHRFTIAEGRVSYGNRFLQSRAYRAAREQGRMVYGEFATDPCRSLFKRVQSIFAGPSFTDNGNVNVAPLGDRYVAMTETPLPVQFDQRTLESAGVHPFTAPGQLSTAHPHGERGTGAMINYAAKLGPRSSYRFFTVDAGSGEISVIGSTPTREPAYMHSFGLTERWLVLAEFPLVVNPISLALSGRPYIENYRWKPELGTRFTLIDRRNGEVRAGFHSDACFSFHHVNAFEDGDEIVVDACVYDDASVIEDLYLGRLRDGKPVSSATLTRFRLGLEDRDVKTERLSEQNIELPRINYGRCNERPYRFVWGTGNGERGWIETIVRIDTSDGSSLLWHQDGCYPGEPVFVARPGAGDEDDGVLLSVVLDDLAGSSFLLVLDARDLSELARASVPHHIPFGFHGQFARA